MVLQKLLTIELVDYFRSPVTAFWTFAYPFLVTGFLVAVFGSSTVQIDELTQIEYGTFLLYGMVCINIVSTSLFGFALPVVENRNKGALKMYHLFPIWTPWYIIAVLLSRVFVSTVFNAAFIVIASFLMSLDLQLSIVGWINFLGLVILSSTAFISVGFFLASVSEKPSTTTTIANVIFFPLIFLSNVFFPANELPNYLQYVAEYSPLQATADSFRSVVLRGQTLIDNSDTVALLLSIFVVFLLGSIRFFKWK